MEKKVECPWCGAAMEPVESYSSTDYGKVKEGRCPKCNRLLSARLAEQQIEKGR